MFNFSVKKLLLILFLFIAINFLNLASLQKRHISYKYQGAQIIDAIATNDESSKKNITETVLVRPKNESPAKNPDKQDRLATSPTILSAINDFSNNRSIIYNANQYIEDLIQKYADCSTQLGSNTSFCKISKATTSALSNTFISSNGQISYLPTVSVFQGGGGSGPGASIVTSTVDLIGGIINKDGISSPNSPNFTIQSGNKVTINNLSTSGKATFTSSASFSDVIKLGSLSSDPVSGEDGETYYNSLTNKFRCYESGVWKNCISTGGSGSALQAREGYSGGFLTIGSISFNSGAFNFNTNGSHASLSIDYTNGPASRSANQTITGLWSFSNGASVSNTLEVSGTASISNLKVAGQSIRLVTSNSIDFDEILASTTLDTNTDIALNSKTLDIGNGTLLISPSNLVTMLSASVSGNFEVSGIASVSQLLVRGQLIRSANSNSLDFDELVASATLHTNLDIALNGNQVDFGNGALFLSASSLRIANTTSISSNLEVVGYASFSSLFVNGVAVTGGSGGRPASNSLDFDEFVASLSLDSNLDVRMDARKIDFGNGLLVLNGNTDSLAFIASTNSTTAFQIASSSGAALFNVDTANDRIGIGTSAPGTRLDIVMNAGFGGGAALPLRLRSTTSTTGSAGEQVGVDLGFSDARRLTIAAAQDSGVGSPYDGTNYLSTFGVPMAFVGGGTLAAGVTTGGNFGVGTTTASTKFQVSGDSTFLPAGSVNGVRITPNADSNTAILNITNAANNTNWLAVNANGQIIMNGTGNVGIGTSVPVSRLDLRGGLVNTGNILTNGSLQVAHTTSVSYSRFGSAATTHSNFITASNDLLISGDLELDGSATFDGLNGNVLAIAGGFNIASVSLGGTLKLHNRAGDPTGVNGLMFYNTTTNKFRCYENGAWTNCVGSGGGSGVASNSLDWDEIVASMTLDTNTDIGFGTRKLDFGNGLLVIDGNADTIKTISSTNSTTAFQIASSSGGSIFNVDTTNDRIGIGTTAPGARLTVDETSNTTEALRLYQRGNDGLIGFYGSRSATDQFFKITQRSMNYFGDRTGADLQFYNIPAFGGTLEARIFTDVNSNISRRALTLQARDADRISFRQGTGNGSGLTNAIGYEYAMVDSAGFYASNSHNTNAALRVRNNSLNAGPLAIFYSSKSASDRLISISQRSAHLFGPSSAGEIRFDFSPNPGGTLEGRLGLTANTDVSRREIFLQARDATNISLRYGTGNGSGIDAIGYQYAMVDSAGFYASNSHSTNAALRLRNGGNGPLAIMYASRSATVPVLKVTQRALNYFGPNAGIDIQFPALDVGTLEGRIFMDSDTNIAGRHAIAIQARDADRISFRQGTGNGSGINAIGYEYFYVGGNTVVASGSGVKMGIGTSNLSTRLEVNGTASAAQGVFTNGLNVSLDGVATVAYSRFGSSTTTHSNYISTSSDLLLSSDLEVKGSISGNIASASKIYAGLTVSTNGFALCHENDGAQASGEQIKDCGAAPSADYMEMYPVSQDADELGTIVMPSTTEYAITTKGDKVAKLIKSNKEYNENMLGIVSNKEDAGDFNSIGYNIQDNDNPTPIALNGRVKVKVSNKNGNIKPGDYITSSDIEGTGMKATKSGRVIGMALESSQDTSDPNEIQNIMVFVNSHYAVISSEDSTQTSDNSLQSTVIGFLKDVYGVVIENGLLKVATIITDFIEAKNGVTTYDTATGQPYCIRVTNGQMVNVPGKCEVIQPSQAPQITPEITASPTIIPESTTLPEIVPEITQNPEISASPEPSNEITPEVTPEVNP